MFCHSIFSYSHIFSRRILSCPTFFHGTHFSSIFRIL
jgi:hypothetical protein